MTKQVDTYGREIDYLRISITDRCNLRCTYCMPENGIEKTSHNHIMRIEEIISFVKVAASEGIKKVRITGGEPLVRRGIISLIEGIAKITSIRDISLTTNGSLLSTYAKDLKAAGLNRLNISLDTLDPLKYKEITRLGDIETVLSGIDCAIEQGFDQIKMNTVLIGGFNDSEIDDFIDYTTSHKIKWRLIELMPIGEVAKWQKKHFISGKACLDRHPLLTLDESTANLRVKQYNHAKLSIQVGLIDAISSNFCGSCNRLRLTSEGKIKPCLHSNEEFDLMPYINDSDGLRQYYRQIILKKPESHHMNESDYQPITKNMNHIGG